MKKARYDPIEENSRCFLKAVMENMTDAVFISDTEGHFLEFNSAFATFHKFKTRDDCFKTLSQWHTLLDVYFPDGRLAPLEMWAVPRALRGESAVDQEYILKRKDTGEQWFGSYTFSPIRGEGGHIIGSIVIGRDITEIKHGKEALNKNETHLNTLINTLTDLVWLKDPDGAYLMCNNQFEKFFNIKKSEIKGKTDSYFIDEKNAASFHAHDHRAMASGIPVINEEELTSSGEGYRSLFETVRAPMRDSVGNLIGVLGIARDITIRKQRESALRENEERYAEASRLAKLGFWNRDFKTGQAYWADETYRIFGVPQDPGQFKPTWDRFLQIIHPSDRTLVKKQVESTLNRGTPMDFHYRIVRPDGTERTIHSIGHVRHDENGIPSKIIGTVHDVTEKESLRKQLHQAQKLEAIGTLAGGIAHDFNNILSSIMGYTQLALKSATPGTMIEKDLKEAYAASERAKELVYQILTFARKADEHIQPIRVDSIIKEVSKFIRSSIPTTIEIHQNINSRSCVMGNPTQIHQIVMNLCTNAAQAMEVSGGILSIDVLDIEITDDSKRQGKLMKPGHFIQIKVSDTGVGMSPDMIDSIFEPYFTTKKKGEGTGLGLAVVKGIVEKSGGKITVSSSPEKGSTFNVLLPITESGSQRPRSEDQDIPKGTERILLIDDETSILIVYKRALEELGYSVETEAISLKALARFKQNPGAFDLVITDMTMPGLTGKQLAVEMMNLRADIPIIICTGYSKRISRQMADEIGIKALLHKPLVFSKLAKIIRNVLDHIPIQF